MIPFRFLAARSIAGPAGMALLYFATAATTVHISRFSGGVAMIWVSSALLSGYLLTAGRRVWPLTIALCAFASFVATGFFGFGWRVAAQLALVNVGEALMAAIMLKRIFDAYWPGDTLEWLAGYYLGIGLAVPMVSGLAALAVTGMVLEIDPGANFVHWMIGHAVGLLTFLPFTISLSYAVHNGQPVLPDNRRLVAVLAVVAMTVLTAVVFSQPNRPLMLFPVLMVVAAAVWAPCVVTTFLPCVLALIGGMLTMRGEGPVAMMHLDLGDRMQFFEIYIAVTVLFALPVQFEQERRRRQMRELAESEARYRLLSDHVSDIIMHLDADGVIRYVSPSILYVSGYDPAGLVGTNVAELIHPDHLQQVHEAGLRARHAPGTPISVEHLALTKLGEPRWFETHFRAVPEDGALICATRDISQRKRLEADLSIAALTDPLTGLSNRRAFFDLAERTVASGVIGCIVVFDIDYFKAVNDRFGHGAGDMVLASVAQAARRALRQTDHIARIGGEEFAVILPETRIDHAEKICVRLCKEISRSAVPVGSIIVRVTVSAGIAVLDGDLSDTLSRADAALYRAKSAGRDRTAVAA